MMRYLAGRLLRALLTIFLVVTFAFFVLRLSGDPALLIMSVDAPPESVEAFRKSWGLDQPIWIRYFGWLGNILQGDFGRSFRTGQTVLQAVTERLPVSLELMIFAEVIGLAIGVPLAIASSGGSPKPS